MTHPLRNSAVTTRAQRMRGMCPMGCPCCTQRWVAVFKLLHVL